MENGPKIKLNTAYHEDRQTTLDVNKTIVVICHI